MIRRRIAMLFLPALVVLTLAATLSWMLRTEPGARWLWSRAGTLVPGSLRAAEVNGSLQSGLILQEVVFEDETTRAELGTVHLQLAFDWLTLALAVDSLTADQVTILLASEGEQQGNSNLTDTLTAMALPFTIRLGSIEVGHLLVLNGDDTKALDARAVHLSARWRDRLSVASAGLRLDALQLELGGSFGFSQPFPVEVNLAGRFEDAGDGAALPPGARLQVHLEGNLDTLEVQATLDQPEISLQGRLLRLLTAPQSDLHLSADTLQWPLAGLDPSVTLDAVKAHLTGAPQNYQLDSEATLILQEMPPTHVQVHAKGDLDGMHLDSAQLSSEIAELNASGLLDWSDGFKLKLATTIEQLVPGRWIADWPASQPLQGTVTANWQAEHLELHDMDLKAGDSGFHLGGHLVFDRAEATLNGQLDWASLQWPLDSSQPDFHSAYGQLRLNGRPDDWTAAGTLQLQAGEWPAGVLTLKGKGNQESAALVIEQAEVLGGRIAGQFKTQWTEHQPWSASIHADALDISSLSDAFPGTASVNLSADGQMNPVQVNVDIDDLHGQIRGQPVQAKGGIAFAAGQLRARDLHIVSGSSELQIDGDARTAEGIRIKGNIESLSRFVNDATGSLAVAGLVSLDPDHPLFRLELEGKDLLWRGWRADSITTTSLEDDGGSPGSRIDIKGLGINDRVFESVSLTTRGERPLEELEIESRRGETTVQARLEGSVLNWSSMPEATWSGRLEALNLGRESLGGMVLERATNLAFSPSSVVVEPACLRGSLNGITCFDLNWTKGGSLSANLTMDAVSLNLVHLIIPTELDFSQSMTGAVHWVEAPGKSTSAQVNFGVSPGKVTAAEGVAELNTGPGIFGFRIEDGQLLGGNLDLTLPGVGVIDTDFRLPEVSLGENSPLEGRVQVMLTNIETLSDWIPGVDGLEGSINADVNLGGTAVDAALTGYASLVRGRVEIEPIGVTLSDIQLAGAVFEHDYTVLTGSFASGQGTGKITASVKFAEILKPEIEVELTGEDLTVTNVPDMTVHVNPNMRLQWRDGGLDVDAYVLVPYARISPRYLPTTNASESDDLAIVAGQKRLREESVFSSSRLRINGSVTVELGKAISVSFHKAKAQLQGKAAFSWNDNLIPVGDGAYTVSGKITAYGQRLEVADGRVSFPHVPANNPHLNITAEREIYGNVQIKKAGVLITGTLKRPVMEAYTSPLTTEERALALLVTGSDFDYDQGVGAVEVGLYIAPKLFVSYGIGLFESQSVISVRYDLKHGFGIKATSGQRETGLDISYTIDH